MFQSSVLSFALVVLLSANGIHSEILDPYLSHENPNNEEEDQPYPGRVHVYIPVFVCVYAERNW